MVQGLVLQVKDLEVVIKEICTILVVAVEQVLQVLMVIVLQMEVREDL